MPKLIKKIGQHLALGGKKNMFGVLLSHGMTLPEKKENIILLCLSQSAYNRNNKVLTAICKACAVPVLELWDKRELLFL